MEWYCMQATKDIVVLLAGFMAVSIGMVLVCLHI
jgi:hypothetical protein